MKISCWLALIVVFLFQMACTDHKSEIPEKGVSYQLNKRRKTTIDSIGYNIQLDIPREKSESIKGIETISFNLNALDSALVLDFNSDSTHIISVQSEGEEIEFEVANQHIVIGPDGLKKGRNTLTIGFIAGNLSLNRSDEYLYTLFVPDRASTCFPLFDQPNLKATYALTLSVPDGWEAVSNGSLKSKTSRSGKCVFQFLETKPISSYLFAFAAGKFSKTEKTVEGRPMTMYYRETDTAKVSRNKKEIFDLHAKSLSWLEDYTGISYPFEKFDFVLIPSFQYGGMEHPGSVFYNESALFLDENASVNEKMARASVIAHESAHMWFGDLVTMDWFNDVWLKEVFANFMAAKIVHPSFPGINHELRFLLAHYPHAYEVDRTAGTNPVLQDLGNLKNAGTLYGAIIYMKAPIIMRQLERKIGTKLMRESLAEYLKTYAYQNARWDDLIRIIDNKTPLDIADWSRVWVKTPGMPEYALSTETNGKYIQKRDSVSNRIWQQPVAFKDITLGQKHFHFPNPDGTGYGYFQMDSASTSYFFTNYNKKGDSIFSKPVFRGAMLVNVWEGFLRGDGPDASALLSDFLKVLPKEKDPLLTDYLLGRVQTIWWSFLSDENRDRYQSAIEKGIWSLLNGTPDKGMKKSYFRTFKRVAMSDDAYQKMESLWNKTLVLNDLALSEDDRISLAYELAVRAKGDEKTILQMQLDSTKNPDRKARMQFVIPSLSQDEGKRDAFFESLKKPENREKEAWVLDGLSNLHHPLRSASAIKYLQPSLEMLQEIQLTGDIFFPTRWTNATFSGHSSRAATDVANKFLAEHPDYPYFLKNKVLQAIDLPQRAARLKR
ncbi:M1 family aminopeptidase [Dyadobacter sp. LJ53]|uniref:M1 family metallopeptidase n=1 Tax=Dyadobacter chenwenxiniae TaxID=2906456 RepID=UPI001F3FC322|nr:M1 family aminopeptidase [Dyadobacter chenwenxiniae]MCF0048930.1 M1 family aminopeptidase [Dyadobacter chenwenxiniae]